MRGLALFGLLLLCERARGGSYIQAETNTGHNVVSMNERGVPVTGKNYLIMQIKACRNAFFVLSEKYSINRIDDKFFLVLIGASDNAATNGVRDSCLKNCLRPSWKIEGKWLDCSSFKTFWISWDKQGGLKFGRGNDLGKNPLMAARTPRPFLINFLFLLGQRSRVEWRFIIDSPPQFVFPLPNGGSTIEIPENTDVQKVVFDMKASDPDKDLVVFSVTGQYSSVFKCAGASVVLIESLDFEAKPVYNVKIVASDNFHSVFTHLTVLVTDVNDNYPEVDDIDPIVIQEQLSVGSMIGVIKSARDVDTHDRLTYSLKGPHNRYFAMDPRTGVIYMGKVIDLEKMSVPFFVANVILVVTDAVGHGTMKMFNINVTDVNDSPPEFSHKSYLVSVKEGGGEIALVTFTLTDADLDSQGNISLALSEESGVFSLRDKTLTANSSLLDYEDTSLCMHRRFVTVYARDGMKELRQNTATATVMVDILARNEHSPVWTHGDSTTLPSVTVTTIGQMDHVVSVLKASDQDEGQDGYVKYRLVSIKDGAKCQVTGAIKVEAETGHVTLPSSLKRCLNPTGYYLLHVQAYDMGTPSRYVDGWMKLQLKIPKDTIKSHEESTSRLRVPDKITKGSVKMRNDVDDESTDTLKINGDNLKRNGNNPKSHGNNPKSKGDNLKSHGYNNKSVGHTIKTDTVTSETVTVNDRDTVKIYTDTLETPDGSTRKEDNQSIAKKKSEACESKFGVILLQSMIGILGFCLLITSSFIACNRKRPAGVYPRSLDCRTCPYTPQRAPLATKEGS